MERFYGNGRCNRARLQCLNLIQATYRKDSDKTSLRDRDVGRIPGQQGYAQTCARRIAGCDRTKDATHSAQCRGEIVIGILHQRHQISDTPYSAKL